jgi:hypothetical protein
MIPTNAASASQTGKAPMLSAPSRVQIDVIDSSGMQVASDCQFDFRTSTTLMESLDSKVWILHPQRPRDTLSPEFV